MIREVWFVVAASFGDFFRFLLSACSVRGVIEIMNSLKNLGVLSYNSFNLE